MSNAVLTASMLPPQHNMRDCNGSASCEFSLKRRAARGMLLSRFCPVVSGDTPTTGRLFDAISCGCLPIIVSDDIQLPFPKTVPFPTAGYGVHIREQAFLADPISTIRRVLEMPPSNLRTLKRQMMGARRMLAYRVRGSAVAALVLKEAWATCLQQRQSSARPPWQVAKC